MTPVEAADALATPVGFFGTRWMMSPRSYQAAAARGHTGLDFYFRGRVGPMGEVPAEVAVSVLAFFEPSLVHDAWRRGPSVEPAEVSARHFADLCAEYGRTRLHADVDLERLAGLLGQVVAAADDAGFPLFAAWRTLDVPSDPGGAAAHHLNGLRELRGAAHVAALRVLGVDPLHAVLNKGGVDNARLFGHLGDLPEVPADVPARCDEAESMTSTVVAQALEALEADERTQLVALVTSATERRS